MPRLVSRAEFARLCNVSKQAVSKACTKALAEACEGDRIDADHPAAVAYRKPKAGAVRRSDGAPTARPKGSRIGREAPTERRKRPVSSTATPTARRPKKVPGVPPATPAELDVYAEEIGAAAKKFGTATSFKDWLTALQKLELVRARQLENDETEGRLIPRDFVKVHVFGFIDACFRRLLGDAAKTITRRNYASKSSNAPVEEAERTTAEILSSHLEELKRSAAKLVRDG